MEKTKEIRWFFPRAAFTPLDWYDQLNFPTEEEGREFYLCLRPEGLEAKINGGKLRLKQRVGTWSNDCLGDQLWGHCLNFISWKFDLQEDGGAYQQILRNADAHWWPVHKKRRTAQVGIEGNETVIRPSGEKLEAGCRISYTQLEVGGASWDTVCFEFYGTSCITLEPSLVRKIVGEREFYIRDSMGYAQFLDEMVDKNRKHLYSEDHVLPMPSAFSEGPAIT